MYYGNKDTFVDNCAKLIYKMLNTEALTVHRTMAITVTVFGPPLASESLKETIYTSMILDLQKHRNVFVESACKKGREGWVG